MVAQASKTGGGSAGLTLALAGALAAHVGIAYVTGLVVEVAPEESEETFVTITLQDDLSSIFKVEVPPVVETDTAPPLPFPDEPPPSAPNLEPSLLPEVVESPPIAKPPPLEVAAPAEIPLSLASQTPPTALSVPVPIQEILGEIAPLRQEPPLLATQVVAADSPSLPPDVERELKRTASPPPATPRQQGVEVVSNEIQVPKDYYNQLRRRVERLAVQRYPRRAQVREEEGTVTLKLVITEAGDLVDVMVLAERSDAGRLLRRAAVRVVKNAAPFGALPKGVGDRVVILPITYRLP